MAFKDLEEGILEEFSSYAQHDGYLRANEDRSFRVKKRTTANKAIASWCVVQCRLCATEHASRESLSRHFAKQHAAAHAYIVQFNRECQAAVARAVAWQHPRVVLIERVLCLHCRKPFGSAGALRMHQRNHHALEHAAATRANRQLLAELWRNPHPRRGPLWWWQHLAPQHRPDHEQSLDEGAR